MEISAQPEPPTAPSTADSQPKTAPRPARSVTAADVTVTQFLHDELDKMRNLDRGDGDADRDAQVALELNITTQHVRTLRHLALASNHFTKGSGTVPSLRRRIHAGRQRVRGR
jgi:hypothetical protein